MICLRNAASYFLRWDCFIPFLLPLIFFGGGHRKIGGGHIIQIQAAKITTFSSSPLRAVPMRAPFLFASSLVGHVTDPPTAQRPFGASLCPHGSSLTVPHGPPPRGPASPDDIAAWIKTELCLPDPPTFFSATQVMRGPDQANDGICDRRLSGGPRRPSLSPPNLPGFPVRQTLRFVQGPSASLVRSGGRGDTKSGRKGAHDGMRKEGRKGAHG